MKVHDVIQGTPEWLALRSGYPTASEFSSLVTPKELKPSKSIGPYVALKIAEAWLGAPLQSFQSSAMDQGTVLEEDARPWYAFEFGVDIETPGFITNDDDTAGCSPDGIVKGVKRGLEIKSPQADTHVKWILAGGVPPEHLLQVQGEIWVCGFEELDFVSYCGLTPHFPQHVFRVKPDKNIHDAIAEAVGKYWERFDEGWAKMVDANGGEEPKRIYDVTYENGAVVKTLKLEGEPLTAEDFDNFMAGSELPQDKIAKGLRTILKEVTQ